MFAFEGEKDSIEVAQDEESNAFADRIRMLDLALSALSRLRADGLFNLFVTFDSVTTV